MYKNTLPLFSLFYDDIFQLSGNISVIYFASRFSSFLLDGSQRTRRLVVVCVAPSRLAAPACLFVRDTVCALVCLSVLNSFSRRLVVVCVAPSSSFLANRVLIIHIRYRRSHTIDQRHSTALRTALSQWFRVLVPRHGSLRTSVANQYWSTRDVCTDATDAGAYPSIATADFCHAATVG
jgi:hypothetical protein